MRDTVNLFILPCILMLHDDTGLIVLDGCTCHNSGLRSSIHHKLIQIIHRGCIFHVIATFNHSIQQFFCLFIYAWCISVHAVIKRRLRPVDAKERKWFSFHCFFCFFPVIYIIWQCCHFTDNFSSRSIRFKWFNNCHVSSPLSISPLPPTDRFIHGSPSLLHRWTSCNLPQKNC